MNENGYVIYPSSTGIAERAIAVSVARQMSANDPSTEYRVEDCDTEQTVARFLAGEEIE